MAVQRLYYAIVTDEEELTAKNEDFRPKRPYWYTKSALQNVLQLVGCKVHHAFKISRRVFDILERITIQELPVANRDRSLNTIIEKIEDIRSKNSVEKMDTGPCAKSKTSSFDLYKDLVTVTVSRRRFIDTICSSLEKYHYVGPSQRDDILLACRLRERKESVTVLLCGTSGCGKSTLSSLLASRLGITTVISTDSVRHMMRSFANEKENPLLWASTYHAGEYLDPKALAKAKARKDKKLSSSHATGQLFPDEPVIPEEDRSSRATDQISEKELAVEGYKAQSEMVIDRLDHLITTWEERRESVVVEGVHLSLNFVMGLMKKHPSVIPFLIYISNEEKHLERFAVRAKYMTLDPSKNKYVKYIKNIRTIQDYLCKRAEKHLVPKVNNTNVDRSVASIHSTIFSCLRKRHTGTPFYDMGTNTAKMINDEYCKQCDSNHIGSKGMFRIIQRQGSLRRYMAVVNDSGAITKAWPFLLSDNSSKDKSMTVGSPIYGPINVSEVAPVNIQFGNFGIGSWPNNNEGTSYARSSNSSKGDPDEDSSRCSSSTSSPTHPNGHEKELVEESAILESEEDQFDDNENDSSYSGEEFDDDEEIGASVTESPARSDEEYEEDVNERMKLNSQRSDTYMLSKRLQRTGSTKPSANDSPEGQRRFSRFRSMPLSRSRSSKVKVTSTRELPSN